MAEFQLLRSVWWLDLTCPSTSHGVQRRSKSTDRVELLGFTPFCHPRRFRNNLRLLGFTSWASWWRPSCHVFSPCGLSCYFLNSYESHLLGARTGRIIYHLTTLNYLLCLIDKSAPLPHTACPTYSWESVARHWQWILRQGRPFRSHHRLSCSDLRLIQLRQTLSVHACFRANQEVAFWLHFVFLPLAPFLRPAEEHLLLTSSTSEKVPAQPTTVLRLAQLAHARLHPRAWQIYVLRRPWFYELAKAWPVDLCP